jgi:hypothetical protein
VTIRTRLLRYLDTKQHLWNTAFKDEVTDLRNCEPLDSFETIDALLFAAMVCRPLNIKLPQDFIFGSHPVPGIVVRPLPGQDSISLLLNRDDKALSGYWDEAKMPAPHSEFEFIDFFQWNKYDFLSMNQVLCRTIQIGGDKSFYERKVILELEHFVFELRK